MVTHERASSLKPGSKLLLAVIFSALVTNIHAGPSRTKGISKCVSFCKESSKFEFEVQKTNYYEYSTQISTSVIGGSSQSSDLFLAATAEISSPSPCELQLQVTNVRIEALRTPTDHLRSSVPGADELIRQLQQYPLSFSFQDGKIEHICPAEEEEIWVLNVKRGIISTIQNTMDNLSQEQTKNDVDVSGRCFTKYEPSGSDNSGNGPRTLQKLKDLKGCSQHHSHLSVFQSIPYTSNSPTQTIPLLTGTQACSQTVVDKKISHVECMEVHVFQPFQNGGSGAQTTVTQKLALVSTKDTERDTNGPIRMRKASLILETQGQHDVSGTDIAKILTLLETLDRESFPKVQSRTPEHFIDLVQELRFVDFDALKIIFERAPGHTGKQHVLDALPLVGTAPSLNLLRLLYQEGKLSEDQTDIWLNSLNFIKSPSIQQISAVESLLNVEPNNQVLLSISSLVHAYCEEHIDCNGESAIVESILTKLTSFLGTTCRMVDANRDDLTGIVVALKAIGNAGRLPSNDENKSFDTLRKCFMEKSNPTEIRLAAVDAFRRIPCGSYKHDPITALLTNVKEDTEVRIHAYLIAMKCPDRQLIKTIEGMLYAEAVNQVGSFVWTHLTNLQETSSPDKQAIKELVSNNFLQNKFSTDARKYSRNYEGTMYWEEENVGVGMDSNVIFTPDSFIPRSAVLNLTCHLFGESVNLLEFGARVHSLEHLLEPLFGPDGYFPDQTINEALHTMRVKRDVFSSDIRRLDTVYSQASYGTEGLPGGSIFARVFGNELAYKTFEISHKTATPSIIDENGKNWLDITHFFDNLATGKSTEFTKSSVLLDASYTVSTCAGIPLSLAVQSAATVALSANGKVDLTRYWDKKELEVQGMFRPSGAIQVHGTLSVQLGRLDSKVKSGLKVQNTLHSSTASQARLTMKGTKIVHLSLTLPEDKQEIFEAKSQVLITQPTGNQEISTETQSQNLQKMCTPKFLSTAFGIQLCSETNLPETFSLFTPASASVYIEKTDEFKSYEMDYKWIEDDDKAEIAFLFSTPGSKIDRKVGADFRYDKQAGTLQTTLQAPGKFFKVDGKYAKYEQGLELLLESGEQQLLHINTAVQRSGGRLEPYLILEFYNKPILEVDGTIDVISIAESGGKISVDLTLNHVTSTPIQLTGDLTNNGDTFDSSLAVQSNLISANSKSQFRVKPYVLSAKSELKYSWKQAETKTINVSAKVQRTKTGALSKYTAMTSYSVSNSPDSNVDIEWETKAGAGYCENKLKYIVGKSRWEGKVLYNRQISRDYHDVRFQSSLFAPRHGIDYNLEIVHQFNATGITCKFNARKDSKNEIASQFHYHTADEPLLKKILSAEIGWPSYKYSLRANVNEIRPGQFESELTIVPNRGEEMKGTVSYRNNATNVSMEQKIEFRLRGFMTSAASGSATLFMSEKLKRVGGELQFDSNKQQPTRRYFASLDYSLIKKNTQKIEGKVSLNEKKYSVLLNYRKVRNGDRNLVIDLHLAKRIRMDGQLKGTLPQGVVGSLILYPDRTANPTSKISLKGSVDPKSVLVMADYFGKVALLSGSSADNVINLGAEWTNNMLFNLTIVAPNLEAANFDLSVNLVTPVDGMAKIGLVIQHQITGGYQVSSTFQSEIEEKKVALTLKGILTSSEFRGNLIAELGQFPKFEGTIDLIQNRDIKSLEFSGGLGDKITSLKLENRRLLRGFNVLLDFSGCAGAPQVLIDFKHQNLEDTSTSLFLQWTPLNSTPKKLSLDVTAGALPWNYKYTFTSPFKQIEKLGGSISWKTNATTKNLELKLDLPLNQVTPVKLNGAVYYENFNFQHKVAFYWPSRRTTKSISAGMEGRISSINDVLIKTSIEFPDNVYKVKVQRNKDDKHHTNQLDVLYNKERASLGTNWHYERSQKFTKIHSYITAEWPSQQKFDHHFHYDQSAGKASFSTYATQGHTTLAKITGHVEYENWQLWDMTATLDSQLEWVPVGSIVSKNVMQQLGEIHHISEVSVTPKVFKFKNGDENQKILLQFDVARSEDILGTIRFSDQEILLTGKVIHIGDRRKANLEISSALFDSVRASGEYQSLAHRFSVLLQAHVKEVSIFRFKSQMEQEDTKISGSLDVASPTGHQIQAKAKLDLGQNALEILLKEDKVHMTSLLISGQILSTRGQAIVDIKSKLYPQLNKFLINSKYQIESDKIQLDAKYLNQETEASITGLGLFTDESKKFHLSVDGPKKIVGEIELLGWNKLSGSVSVGSVQMVAFDLEHTVERGEFALGKHIFTANLNTGKIHTIVATAGLDLNRFELTVNTPFHGWTELGLSGKFKMLPEDKSIFVSASRESDVYTANFESLIGAETGHFLVRIETPIRGFTSAEAQATYSLGTNIENTITISLEDRTISLLATLTASKAELRIDTPFDILSTASVSGEYISEPNQLIRVVISKNELSYQAEASLKFLAGIFEANLSVAAPAKYNLELNYDISSDYRGKAAIVAGGIRYEIGGFIVAHDRAIEARFYSPFSGFEDISASVGYNQLDTGEHAIGLEWDLNGKSARADFKILVQPGRIQLNAKTPYHPWDSFTVSLTYIEDQSKREIDMQLERGDGKYLGISSETIRIGGNFTDLSRPMSASIRLNIRSNLTSTKDFKLNGKYDRQGLNHEFSAMSNIFEEPMEVKAKIQVVQTHLFHADIDAKVSVPAYGIKQASLAGFLHLDLNQDSNLKATVNYNGKTNMVESTFKISKSQINFRTQTSYHPLSILQISGQYMSDGRIDAIVQINEKRVETTGQILWNGLKHIKVILEITTPFDGYKSVHLESDTKYASGQGTAAILVQNDHVRYSTKIEGSIAVGSGYFIVQFNTPIFKMEQVLTSLQYNSTGVRIKMDRNTKEEINGQFVFNDEALQLNLISKIPGYQVNSKSSFNFGRTSTDGKISFDAGIFGQRINVKTNIKGISSCNIEITTTIKNFEHLNLKWNLEGSIQSGVGGASYSIPNLGQKSVRISWKKDDKKVNAQFWLNSTNYLNEKGFIVEYSLTPFKPGSCKFVGSLKYVLDRREQELTMSASWKQTGKKTAFDFNLITPFQPIQELKVSGAVGTNPEIDASIVVVRNQVELLSSNATILISPLYSKLKVTFNASWLCDPFDLSAAYDLTTIGKTLDISFLQNEYQIAVNILVVVPHNSQEIELRMAVVSNVPSVTVSASGSLKASYKVEHDGTRQVTLSIDSEHTGKWKIITSVRPTENFALKISLDSPNPDLVPSILAEAKWNGNFKEGVNSEFMVRAAKPDEVKITLTTTPQKILATFKSSIAGLESISLEGKYDAINGYKASVEVNAARARVALTGQISLISKLSSGSGSIVLTSSWPAIPSASLDVKLSEKGDLEITGISGERNVSVNGKIKNGKHMSFWKSGVVELKFTVDSREQFQVKTSHYFSRPQFSLNVTSGEYSVESYIYSDSKRSTVLASVKWDKIVKLIQLSAETKSGHFTGSLITPWTAESKITGTFVISPELRSAKATLTYDGVQSVLEANVATKADSFKSRVNVDIPAFNQKFDASININKPTKHIVEGSLEFQMTDRHLAVRGSLTTAQPRTSSGFKTEEKTLELAILFPNSKYSDIKTEINIIKPLEGFASLTVDAKIVFPSGISKVILQYELPLQGSHKLGTVFAINSPLLTVEEISGAINVDLHSSDHVNATLKYGENDLKMSWKLGTKINANVYAYLPTIYEGSSPLSIVADGHFDFPNHLALQILSTYDKHTLRSDTSFLQNQGGFNSKLLFHAPTLLENKQEFYFNLNKVGPGNFITDVTGRNGKTAVIAIGEFVLRSQGLSLTGKMSGTYGAHFIHVVGSREGDSFLGAVTGESLKLLGGKKLAVSGRFDVLKAGFEANVECKTGKGTHGAAIRASLSPSEGVLLFKIKSGGLTPVLFDSQYMLTHNYYSAKIDANFAGQNHLLEAKFDKRNREVQLLAKCPFISTELFSVHLKCAIYEKDISLVGDVNLLGDQWRFEATTKFAQTDDIDIKLELKIPNEALERITAAIKLDADEARFELHTPIENLPSILISLTGVPIFEQFNWRNIRPEVTIGLSSVVYSASAIFQIPDETNAGEFRLMFEQNQSKKEAKRFEAGIQISAMGEFSTDMDAPVLLKFDASTPYPNFKTFQCELGGNLQWKNWAEIKVAGTLNDQQVSFVTEIRSEADAQKFTAELLTPFKNYDRFSFTGRVQRFEEIGFGRSIQVEFYHPGWEKSISLEVDYNFRFEGLINMEGELSLNAPGMQIPPLILHMTSTLKDLAYIASVEGSWGEHRPSLKLEASNSGTKVITSLELITSFDQDYHGSIELGFNDFKKDKGVTCVVEINHDEIFSFNLSYLLNADALESKIVLQTPFSAISSASTLLRVSPLLSRDTIGFWNVLKALDVTLEASLNDNKLLHLELVNRNGRTSLVIQNPFQPISFAISFDRQPLKTRLYSELCWNLLKPEETTRALEVELDKRSGSHDITLKIFGGEKGSVHLFLSHFLTTSKSDHKLKLKWSRPSQSQEWDIGFGLLLNSDSSVYGKEKHETIVHFDTPWRSVQLESFVEIGENVFSRLLMVKWDALKNPYKRIGARYSREKIPSWRSHSEKKTLTLVHAGLPHDLTFTLQKSYERDEIQFTEFTIQPNSFPQDQLTVRISHVDLKGEGVQLIVILQSINIDVNMIYRTRHSTKSLHISHMDLQGERHVLNLVTTMKPGVAVLDIQAGSELSVINIFHLDWRPEINNQKLNFNIGSVAFDAKLDRSLPLITSNMKFNYGRQLSLLAGLPHKKEVIFKISRNELGMNINELLMSLKLNASKILSSKINWRPELFADLQELSKEVPRSLGGYIGTAIPKGLAQINDEIEGRLELLDPGINRLIDTLKAYTHEEFDKFYIELYGVFEHMFVLALNNPYLSPIIESLAEMSLEPLQDFGVKIIKTLENLAAAVIQVSNKIYVFGKTIFEKSYGKLESLTMPLWDQGENIIIRLWQTILKRFDFLITKVEYVYSTLKNIIEGNLEALNQQISGVELLRRLKALVQNYWSWLGELPIQEYTGQLRDIFVQYIWHPLEHYSKPCFVVLNKIIEDGNLFALFEIPPLPYIRYVGLKMAGAVTGVWRLVEAEQKIRELFRHILQNLDNIMQRHIPTASMVWDLKKGQIEYHQPLNLVAWDDFTQMPQLQLASEDEFDSQQINDFYMSILDTMRSSQPFMDLNVREILPPFGSHALMAGDYHYYTFDKKYFRFAGECSYVLVADLLHQNFTIVANYENRNGEAQKKSYSIVSGDKIIEIDTRTLRVTLQGRKVELPLEVGPTFIRRQPTGLEVFDSRGFQIRCTLSPSICLISVSGWYFGKLGGLLGTYDNENTNDFKTPDGQIVTDAATFAHSWRVGGNSEQCRVKNLVKNEIQHKHVDGICAELFQNNNSPFRPCFGTVDPTAFIEMCKYDTNKNLNSAYRQESSCTAIGAYVLECQKNKIDLWMPPSCVRCKLEDGSTITSGDNITLSADGLMKPPMSSDIVLLVEEAAALQGYNLNEIMNKLDVALQAEGLTQNRYATVHYGGTGPHRKPHIHTVAGQVWVHNTLRKFSNDNTMEGQGGGDLYEAIEYSATIGYRAAVSKVMIAIVADDEKCGDKERYPDALTLLVENDFRLHILTPKDFSLKIAKKNEDGRNVFGVDIEGVYNSRHTKQLTMEPEKAMRQHIVISKDFCTTLAMESNGTRFNLKHLHRTSAKKFMDVWSRRVAKSSHPSECQNCECVPDKNGGSTMFCSHCVSPHFRKFMDDFAKYDQEDMDEQSLADNYDIANDN